MKFCDGLKKLCLFLLIVWVGMTGSTSDCLTKAEADSDSGLSSVWSTLVGQIASFVEPILKYEVKIQQFGTKGLQLSNRLVTIEFGPYFRKKKNPVQRSGRKWPEGGYTELPKKVPDLITAAGYDYEIHDNVNTADGYILTLFRLKRETGCQVQKEFDYSILFQHGFLGTAADWLVLEPENGLPFIYHELGFDVWLANSRGNEYSMRHKWLKPSLPKFWNFSFDEMGRYDTPAILNHILNTTQVESGKNNKSKEIVFVGHGMGTTIFYVCMSLYGERYQSTVVGIIALGPFAFLSRMTSPVRELVPYTKHYKMYHNDGPLLPSTVSSYLHFNLPELCRVRKNGTNICSLFSLFIYGNNNLDFNETTLSRVAAQYPSTTSVKTFVHYLQLIEKDQFRNFDYGPVKNMLAYSQPVPPQYNLFNVTFRNVNMYGEKDILLDSRNVERTIRETGSIRGQTNFLLLDFNHIDLIYGNVAPILVDVVNQFSLSIELDKQTRCYKMCNPKTDCDAPQEPETTAPFDESTPEDDTTSLNQV